MRFPQTRHAVAAAVALALATALAAGQTQSSGSGEPAIPRDASALEGTPTVRLEVSREGTKREELDRRDAASNTLRIDIVNGRYYWTSREKRPLTLTDSGEFIYLTSTEPGRYIRFRRINDRLQYVEHVDMDFGSVTYWGELKVVLGR